jgi:hypothetical protein
MDNNNEDNFSRNKSFEKKMRKIALYNYAIRVCSFTGFIFIILMIVGYYENINWLARSIFSVLILICIFGIRILLKRNILYLNYICKVTSKDELINFIQKSSLWPVIIYHVILLVTISYCEISNATSVVVGQEAVHFRYSWVLMSFIIIYSFYSWVRMNGVIKKRENIINDQTRQ